MNHCKGSRADLLFYEMKRIGIYLLRLFGTIAISLIITFSMGYLRCYVFDSIMTLIPAFINTMFDFNISNIADAMFINSIFHGLGTEILSYQDNGLIIKFAFFIRAIIVCVVVAIIYFFIIGLAKTIKKNKVMCIASALLFTDFFVSDCLFQFTAIDYLNKGVFFYVVSSILLLIELYAYCTTIYLCWTNKYIE